MSLACSTSDSLAGLLLLAHSNGCCRQEMIHQSPLATKGDHEGPETIKNAMSVVPQSSEPRPTSVQADVELTDASFLF